MNILITGATGFLGTTFLSCLKKSGLFANDSLFLLTSREIPGYRCILHKNYTFTKEELIRGGLEHVDIVFHLGSAVPRTKEEYNLNYTVKFAENVHNTIHLWNNLPNIPAKFIFTSSVDVYHNNGEEINEDTPLQLNSMYSASKIMCEKYLEQVCAENKTVLQILRLGQIYGPGEDVYAKILSAFMKQAMEGRRINIFSDGSDIRSMLLAEDCCRCIAQAADFDTYIGPVNIASSQSVTLKELVDLIFKTIGKEPDVQYGSSTDIKKNLFNTSKMNRLFNLKETPTADGIRAYYAYYLEKYVKEKNS